MHALEISRLRLVTGFHQRFESSGDQGGDAAAEDGLFTEQVGFGFFLERCVQHAGPGATDAPCISQADFTGHTAAVLMNSQQTGDAGTFGILAADQMTGTFGRDHEHIDVGSRLDLTKVNVEAVGKRESSAGFEVGSDMLAEGGGLLFIRDQDHHDIRLGRGFSYGCDFQAGCFGFGPGFAALVQADGDIDAAFLQIEGVGMALAAVTDNSDFAVEHEIPVGILIIVEFFHYAIPLS